MNLALGHVTRQSQSFVLHQSMKLLRLSAAELTELLAETAQVNPHLVLHRPRRRFLMGVGSTDILEQTAAAEAESLVAHVQSELSGLLSRGGMLARVITCLMEELEPSGWIPADLGVIAHRLGIEEKLVEATLKLVQARVSPTGLFARDLRECLRLQLAEQGEVSATMDAILAHLPLLEKAGTEALARAVDLPPDEVSMCLSRIRQLNPKPGAGFGDDPAMTRAPDARVTWEGEAWKVRYNRETEPSVEIAPIAGAGVNAALSEALKQARGLKWALELRRSATRQVIGALVSRQTAYLRHGPGALRPLIMAELASETGFHTSTVSRVLNGYLLETPQGVVEAKVLCPGSVSRLGGAHSKAQVVARIRALIAAEDPEAPLSDVSLAGMLKAGGIAVSRRVAANYRHQCGFPRAALRRKTR